MKKPKKSILNKLNTQQHKRIQKKKKVWIPRLNCQTHGLGHEIGKTL